MNKSLMIATKPKYTHMIIEGKKDYEFRNYMIPTGTKVYLYESLGKKIKYNGKYCSTQNCNDCNMQGCHEGKGKVIGEFVVGMVIEMDKIEYLGNYTNGVDTLGMYLYKGEYLGPFTYEIKNQGYTNAKYAHKITNLIIYDEPLDIKEFVGWNKLFADTEGCITYPSFKMEDNKHMDIKYYKLTSPPQGRAYVVEK